MILKKKQKNKGFMSGFTLIELMVATTIFTIVMLVGVGSLVTSSNAAKSAQKLQIAVDNVNFAMESMTREIRMGTYYFSGNGTFSLGGPTTSGDGSGNGIAFTPQQIPAAPARVAYVLNGGKIQRVVGGIYTDITSPEVTIQGIIFNVRGSSLMDKIQPSVKILIKGVVNVGVGTPFALQTMASQRSAEK